MARKWSAYASGGHRVALDYTILNEVTHEDNLMQVEWRFLQGIDASSYSGTGSVAWNGGGGTGGTGVSGSSSEPLIGTALTDHGSQIAVYQSFYGGSVNRSVEMTGIATGRSGTAYVQFGLTIPRRPTAQPEKPGVPVVSDLTQHTMTLTWADLTNDQWNGPDEDRYWRVQISPNDSFTNLHRNGRWESGQGFTGLSRSKQYWVRIRPEGDWWDADRKGPWSDVVTFTTPPDPPSAPHSYSAQEISRNSASGMGTKLDDNGGQAPDDIEVQWNTTQSATGASSNVMGAWVKTRMTGLTATTGYWFRQRAHNSAGWSDWGPWVSFTTITDAPDDPAPVTTPNVLDNSIEVAWVEPALNGSTITSYQVRLSTNSSMTQLVRYANIDPSVFSTVFEDLTPGTDYWADVRAVAEPNYSGPSVPTQVSTTGAVVSLFPSINVGGVWYPFILWLNVAGVWKQIKLGLNVAGQWKETE